MALYRRGNIWWYTFTIAGQRIQESTRTPKKTLAIEIMKRRRADLERAAAGLPTACDTAVRIAHVEKLVKEFVERQSILAAIGSIAPKTAATLRDRSRHLIRLLGRRLRTDLSESAVLNYIERRKMEGAGPRSINMEVALLARSLGASRKNLWPKIPMLKEPHDVGRALSIEEQHRLLSTAEGSRSRYIGLAIKLALLSGMRFDEIRTLTWQAIDFTRGDIIVLKSKSEAGTRRTVPLAKSLAADLERYRVWYEEHLGHPQPKWYVFPHSCGVQPVDPTRPCLTLKHAWESVRKAAGVACRFHDLRHTAITRMLEAGAPEHAVRAIVGHIAPKMLERYAHMRMEVKRQAIEALERGVALSQPATISTTVPDSPPTDPAASA
ncbi:MAG: tyrosine-type recombinase/integrase [Kiritimatiellia bacterium]